MAPYEDEIETGFKWKRWLVVGVLVVAAAGAGWKYYTWRSAGRQRQIEAYRQNQANPDPRIRIQAVEGLLRLTPLDERLRLSRAETLVELGRHHEAREELQGLIRDRTTMLERVVTLEIESYFVEANNEIHRVSLRDSDRLIPRVESLMSGVEAESKLLATPANAQTLRVLEARRLDVTVRAWQVGVAAKRVDLTRAQLGQVNQTIDQVTIQVEDHEKRVRELGKSLAMLCDKILADDPANAVAMELQFATDIRAARYDGARQMAARIAALPKLPVSVIGRVADTLLNVEEYFAAPASEQDVELAGRLLTHPTQEGTPDDLYDIARAQFELRRGNGAEAEKLAGKLLAEHHLHVRLKCIQALARHQQGNIEGARRELERFNETTRDARSLHALGDIYLLTGDPRLVSTGHEMLRQSLELEPNNLAARLRLIESLVKNKHVAEAADDIRIADQINAKHPRVMALKARLAVERMDLRSLAELIDQQSTVLAATLKWQHLAVVGAMVLDDVPRVRALAGDLAQQTTHDSIVMIAQAWSITEPTKRGLVSTAVARAILAIADGDPLTRGSDPATPVLGSHEKRAQAGTGDLDARLEPLTTNYFIRRPLDTGLELMACGMDRWPGTSALSVLAAEMNLWLGRPEAAREHLKLIPPDDRFFRSDLVPVMNAMLAGDDAQARVLIARMASESKEVPATVRWLDLWLALNKGEPRGIAESLKALIDEHPWAETALLATVIDAVRKNQADLAYVRIGLAEQTNPKLAHLARGRYNMSLGRTAEALHDAEMLVREEDAHTEVRRWAAEVRAGVHLLLDQHSLAVGVLDQLAATVGESEIDVKIAVVDVLIASGKPHAAAELLSGLLATPETPPRIMDQLLARAAKVMKTSRLRALVDNLLSFRAKDPVLLLYQARLAAEEDFIVGERMLRSLIKQHPDAPRPLMELAAVLRAIQPDESRRIYTNLTKRGGSIGAAAQRALDQMSRAFFAPSVTAPTAVNVEGSEP